jgi:NADH:ubiquinone oxidoreductase subunit E
MSASGQPNIERLGERKHGRRQEEVPQELRDLVPRFGHGSRVPGWDDAADLEKDPIEVPDPAVTPVPAELRAEIEAHMAKYPDRRSAALPCLAAAQRLHGWCSPEAIAQVATVMRLTPAYLVSVASFYDMLDTRPVPRHRVYVCTNISCSLNGGRQLAERMKAQVGDDADIHVRGFECLGACDIAPMASVDGVFVGPIELDEVPELVDQIRAGEPPLPAKQLRRRLSADPNANTRDFPAVDEDPTSADRRPHAADPDAGLPVRPPASGVAGDMPGDQPGPSAPLEQAPETPEGPGTES